MSREFNGQPVYWVAAYLVDGLLIDTGCRHTSTELTAFLKHRPPTKVVNTHYHEDHVGGNHDIRECFGVEIYAHPTSVPLIARRHPLYPYQEIAWGAPVPTRVKPVSDVLTTERYAFRIVDTPGHCAGHLCLFEPSRGWCFTGDLFARETPKFIRPEEDIGEMIHSMSRLRQLPGDRLVLLTSLGKIVEDGRSALGQCIDYLTQLAARVQGLSRAGLTIGEIVHREFGGEHPFSPLTDGQFSTYNLVRSLLETVRTG